MKKTLQKNRMLVAFIAIALTLVVTHTLFFDHGITFQRHDPAVPYTKDEQQALVAEQEQEDERGENGPLKAQISAVEAQNRVLNVHR